MTTQAELFDDFMRAAWDDGIIDKAGESRYDIYRDANTTAAVMGAVMSAKPTGEQRVSGDRVFHEWLFPDGSDVYIEADGNAIE